MNALPETGFLTERQILGQREITEAEAARNRNEAKSASERGEKQNTKPRKARPATTPIIPVGKTCWWQGVASGRFPKPVTIGGRRAFWRVEDIRALIASGKVAP